MTVSGLNAQYVITLNNGKTLISEGDRLVFTGDEASGYTTMDGKVKLEHISKITSPDKLVTLKITKVTAIGVEFDITPTKDDFKYFYDLMSIEKANGLDGNSDNGYTADDLIEFARSWWTMVADMYGGNWYDYAQNDLSQGAQHADNRNTVAAFKWDTDNLVCVYGMDTKGEVTTPVYIVEFRTKSRELDPEQSFNVDVKRVIGKSVEFTVTPAKEGQYMVNIQKKATVDNEKYTDPATGKISDDLLFDAIYNAYLGNELSYVLHSGEKFFDQTRYAGRTPDTDYCIIVFGFDSIKGATTDATIVPFHTLKFTDLSLCVDRTTATGAQFTIVPTKDEIKYFYSIMSKAEADALDENAENGYTPDELFNYQKKNWEMNAQYGSGNWLTEASANLVTGPLEAISSADIIPAMNWDTEYVLYAFGLDTETGELSTPVRTSEFRTAPHGVSDNELGVVIDNVYKNRVDYTITTTNNDTYFVDVQTKSFTDYYYNMEAGTGSEQDLAYKLISGKAGNGLLDNFIFSGNKVVAPEASIGLSGARDHFVVIFGYDKEKGLTTPVQLIPFKTKKSTDITIKIDGVSATDVNFTIVPTKNTINYFYTAMTLDEAINVNPDSNGYTAQELFDNQVAKWKETYGEETWATDVQSLLVKDNSTAAVSTFVQAVKPGTPYVILSFGLDANGEATTPITVREASTLAE